MTLTKVLVLSLLAIGFVASDINVAEAGSRSSSSSSSSSRSSSSSSSFSKSSSPSTTPDRSSTSGTVFGSSSKSTTSSSTPFTTTRVKSSTPATGLYGSSTPGTKTVNTVKSGGAKPFGSVPSASNKSEATAKATALNNTSKPMTASELNASGAKQVSPNSIFKPNDTNVKGLQDVDAKLVGMTPSSPGYSQLVQQRTVYRTQVIQSYPSVIVQPYYYSPNVVYVPTFTPNHIHVVDYPDQEINYTQEIEEVHDDSFWWKVLLFTGGTVGFIAFLIWYKQRQMNIESVYSRTRR